MQAKRHNKYFLLHRENRVFFDKKIKIIVTKDFDHKNTRKVPLPLRKVPARLHGNLHGSMKRNLPVAIIPLSLPISSRAPQPNPNSLLPPQHIGCVSGIYPKAVHLR